MISFKFLNPNLMLPILPPHPLKTSFQRFSPPITLLKNCDHLKKSRQRELKASFLDLPLLPFESEELSFKTGGRHPLSLAGVNEKNRKNRKLYLRCYTILHYTDPHCKHRLVLVIEGSRRINFIIRFLALLEESLVGQKKLFVHFVLDPILRRGTPAGASFAARYGCLVLVEKVETMEIGALVSIRGIGRVSIVKLIQMEPYLRGVVVPMQDKISECKTEVNAMTMELKETLFNLQMLQIKLKTSKDELLQTCLTNSLRWAEKEPLVDCDKAFIPTLPERISFAALQPVTGSTNSELLALRREKLRAMDVENTLDRLSSSLKLMKQSTAMLAAKLAIQSLET
ncbi:uncharacterized protein [Aristolochia californica]|uniref:uncharacterized protein isoform X1 n=1 Tax=Aristolochia californica TaxID=171875 RepID=UPI0035DAE124